jgi:peptide-methionine (S)-S-oxide reductase
MVIAIPNSFLTVLFSVLVCYSCSGNSSKEIPINNSTMNQTNTDTATFGAGCFWCVEAVFQNLKGVLKVESGYSGGATENPTYREVCSGTTGHAEVCQIIYDPNLVSFDELLEVFWKTHDPTTLNYQGNDVGTQYRSAIFYHTEHQRERATYYKNKLNEEKAYPNPVVTEITPVSKFFKAEDYHQNYFNLHGEEQYCKFVIQPKVEKFKKVFSNKLKAKN